jgi:hypothetical protein
VRPTARIYVDFRPKEEDNSAMDEELARLKRLKLQEYAARETSKGETVMRKG